ncbi:hypothetical protein WJX73_007007 [Symbiochloris irregularis]|uniref:Secreted protein n=1 Tax=Symbiochloris irregularis TaxID=706552 RepID=A0AAW1NSR0_9CHLO
MLKTQIAFVLCSLSTAGWTRLPKRCPDSLPSGGARDREEGMMLPRARRSPLKYSTLSTALSATPRLAPGVRTMCTTSFR